MQIERWLPVAGYEGLYEVSSLGHVRSLDHIVKNRYSTALRRGRILIQSPDRAGYLQVHLSNRDKIATAKVHRLVAAAFLGNPPHLTAHVNHLDFSKSNNAVENLEWCSPKQNMRHASVGGRFEGAVSTKRAKKLTAQKVLSIRAASRNGETALSISKRFGVSRPTIGKILAGKIWVRV